MLTAILVFAVIFLVLFFLQLNQGALGGLQGLTGQDLELFKENKERGMVKYLRIASIISMSMVILLSLIDVAIQG